MPRESPCSSSPLVKRHRMRGYRKAMRIVTRIQLSALPAIIGLFTVALLAYFGEYQREAPELLVVLVAVAAVGSSLLAWHNARVLVRRVRALASGVRALGVSTPLVRAPGDEFDELDDIRDIVQQWAAADERRRVAAAEQVAAADRRVAEYEALLRTLSLDVQARLEEARLALHILQTSPFGELNENQEELVAAARSGTELVNDDLQTLQRLVTAAARASTLSPQRCTVRTLLDIPLAMAFGGEAGVTASTRVEVPADTPWLELPLTEAHEALAVLLKVAADALDPGTRLTIDVQPAPSGVALAVSPYPSLPAPPSLRIALALRLLEVSGVQVTASDGQRLTMQFARSDQRVGAVDRGGTNP
jgi:hypothetical protein